MRSLPLALVLVLALTGLAACGGDSFEDEQRGAIDAARDLYEEERLDGRDFGDGPCLADPLPEPRDDWVVVVAPEENGEAGEPDLDRCSAFADGRAEHFVALDPYGHLIEAR